MLIYMWNVCTLEARCLLHSLAKLSAIRLDSFQAKHKGILMRKSLGKKLHLLCNLTGDMLQMREVVLCPAQAAGIMTFRVIIWLGIHAIAKVMAMWRETSSRASHSFLPSCQMKHCCMMPKGVERRSLCTLLLALSFTIGNKNYNILPSYKM